MTREELLKSPEYWVVKAQAELYECAVAVKEQTGKSWEELAEYLGVSGRCITSLISGEYDYRLSSLVELSLSLGYAPKIDFIPLKQYIDKDAKKYNNK